MSEEGLGVYIGEDERADIEERIGRAIKACQLARTLPVAIQLRLGAESTLVFELTYDQTEGWYFKADGLFELAGVPCQTWKVKL